MNIISAIILGAVEGITEFLPISSTGHLILASKLLGITSTEFVKSFEIFIQSGSILAVAFLFGKELVKKKGTLKRVVVAFIPTAIIGLILYKFIKTYLLGNAWVTVLALGIGGVALIIIELYFKREKEEKIKLTTISSLSYKKAALIGIFQAISIIPGVSRSAASIIGGMYLGMDRKTAVEFSFLLAIPTLLAATGLDLVKTDFHFSASEWVFLAAGFVSSFIVALLVIKWFMSYVKRYTFIPFGVYRIIAAILFALLFLG